MDIKILQKTWILRFNRTFMELKFNNSSGEFIIDCFNRTFMELKLSDRLVTEETEGLF